MDRKNLSKYNLFVCLSIMWLICALNPVNKQDVLECWYLLTPHPFGIKDVYFIGYQLSCLGIIYH